MRRFIEARRKYLLAHAELTKPYPAIASVERSEVQAKQPVQVVATLETKVPAAKVLLYCATGRGAPFKPVEMTAAAADSGSRKYTGTIPAASAGTEVYYYVEARADEKLGTASFHPARAEMGASHYVVK
jgi:hypothetical protein